MALSSTMVLFDISLSDMDRGVYEDLELKVARHPSESDVYMVARVLAYALEYSEGIAFSRGLAVADEPAVWVWDLTGRTEAWIEVGTPDAARLHRASKAADRVVVYCHKKLGPYMRALSGGRVHAAETVSIVELERSFVSSVAELLERRNRLALSVTEGQLYVDVGGESLDTTLNRHALPG
jgi:uncharacterized protein YaeQ